MRSRGHAARDGRGGGEADGPRFFPLNDQLSEGGVGEQPGFATRPAEDRFKCHAPTDADESHSIHHNAHKVGHFACSWLFVVLEWVTAVRQYPPFSGSIRVA